MFYIHLNRALILKFYLQTKLINDHRPKIERKAQKMLSKCKSQLTKENEIDTITQ